MPSCIHISANFVRIDIDGVCLWFSYRTLVAFQAHGKAVIYRENDWGPTTGKHLNQIEPDKAKRVTAEAFQVAYSDIGLVSA